MRLLGVERALVVTDRGSWTPGLREQIGIFCVVRSRTRCSPESRRPSPEAARWRTLAAFRDAEAEPRRRRPGCTRADRRRQARPPSGAKAGSPITFSRHPKRHRCNAPPRRCSSGRRCTELRRQRAEVRAESKYRCRVSTVRQAGSAPRAPPRTAVLDANISAYAPTEDRIAAAFDALTYSVEGFVRQERHPIAELVAEGAIARASRYIESPPSPRETARPEAGPEDDR